MTQQTYQGYRRFRCRACGKQFNERSDGILNGAQFPSDVIAPVVFWRLRYKLSLRDLPEMFPIRGIEFTYKAVRDWEAKLTTTLTDRGQSVGCQLNNAKSELLENMLCRGIVRQEGRSTVGHECVRQPRKAMSNRTRSMADGKADRAERDAAIWFAVPARCVPWLTFPKSRTTKFANVRG